MKVLFIVNTEDLGFEEPLGILYLSAISKKNGHKVYALENNFKHIENKLKTINPDLIAVSVITPNFYYLFKTIMKVKAKYNIPTVFGGPHATFFPEIIKYRAIDYVFRGECEEVFPEFLGALEYGKSPNEINNLVLKESDIKIKQNPLKALIPNLDILPFPDRQLLEGHKEFYKSDVRSVIVSRGCPYNCSYCFNKQFHQLYDEPSDSRMRLRTVDNVVEECLELKKAYRAKMIHFFDDIFPFQKAWLEEFSDKYSKKVGLPFFTNTHFDVCTRDYVENLSMAGCKTLLIGVETGDEELRKKILNRKMANKMMLERANLIHSYGIKIYTQNIVGLPFGSLAKDIETLKLNIDLKSDLAGAYLCQPYPKTDIENMARDAGLLDDNYKISRSFYYSSPFNLPEKKAIEKLRTLFAIIVNFPFLFKYTYALLRFPDLVTKFAAFILHGYKIKTIVLRYKMSFRVFLENLRIFSTRKINSAFWRPDKNSNLKIEEEI